MSETAAMAETKPEAPVERVSKSATTVLLYGEGGCGKTSQLEDIAKWLWEKHKLRSRMVTYDSSYTPVEPQVRELWRIQNTGRQENRAGQILEVQTYIQEIVNPKGCIDLLDCRGDLNPFLTTRLLCQGAWPAETAPGSKLYQLSRIALKTKWDEIGAIFLESHTGMADAFQADYVANSRKLSEDVIGEFSCYAAVDGKEEVLKFSNTGRSHVGHTQNVIYTQLVPKAAALPVRYVIWTTHQTVGADETRDKSTSASEAGPASVGTAMVGRSVGKFGWVLHFEKFGEPGAQKLDVFYDDHKDRNNPVRKWNAKISISLTLKAGLVKEFKGGKVSMGLGEPGLSRLFEWYEEALKREKG